MRGVAALAVAIVAMLLVSGHAGALPAPRVREAAPQVVDVVLDVVDTRAEAMAERAERLVARARGPLGLVPSMQDGVEVRVAMVQPVLRGDDDIAAALWIAADGALWTGAYWVESDAGISAPNLIQLDGEGSVLLLEAGEHAKGVHIHATLHLLGVDGVATRHALTPIPVLDALPTTGGAEAGGAAASARGEGNEALFITPWNLAGGPRVMGMTLRAGGAILSDIRVGGCENPAAKESERGCRPLYVLRFAPELTHVELWHVENGVRVVDRTLPRDALLAGLTFGL